MLNIMKNFSIILFFNIFFLYFHYLNYIVKSNKLILEKKINFLII